MVLTHMKTAQFLAKSPHVALLWHSISSQQEKCANEKLHKDGRKLLLAMCGHGGVFLSNILFIWPPVTSQTQREAFCADDGYDAGVEISTDHSGTLHSGDLRDRGEHPGMSHL